MILTRAFATAAFAVSALAVNVADISGISFIDTTTKGRLQIVGVDYQPGGESGYNPTSGADVLSDASTCLRDAVLMQKLGINTIRVYNVNPATNHDACMSIFNAAGIYLIIDVNTPQMSINRYDPASTYSAAYTSFIFSQVENFKNYPNTLAFHSANEVINDNKSAGMDPMYLRAVTRDLRQYIAKHSSRHIPVGYSAADYRDVLQDTWNYMQCAINGDANDQSRSEFFGLNSYSWCSADATYISAGYDTLVAMFAPTSIPVFFSEYGCNKPQGVPRVFNEVAALYGTNMTGLNGGLVYEYSEEPDDYGLVTIGSGGSVTLRQDYVNLLGQFNKLDLNLQTQVPSTTNTPPACSTTLVNGASGLGNNFTIPAAPDGTADLIANGVPNAVSGKIVPVTNLNVAQKVFDVSGNPITGLSLNQISGSNVPSGHNITSGSGSGNSGGSSGGSSGKKSAGVAVQAKASVTVLAVLAAVMAVFL